MLKDDLSKLAEANGKDIVTTFTDFLDYTIGYFDPFGGKIEGWKYDKEQTAKFYGCLVSLIGAYKDGTVSRGWCDPLGDTFMDLMKGVARYRGQYFTPCDLCDLMAETTMRGEMPEGSMTAFGRRAIVNDPTCGSGRNLLAAEVRADNLKWKKRPYLVGEDVDDLCVKMTAINLAIHGCFGEVVRHNTLSNPNGVEAGYIINETMWPVPTPVVSIRFSKDPKDFFKTGYGRI